LDKQAASTALNVDCWVSLQLSRYEEGIMFTKQKQMKIISILVMATPDYPSLMRNIVDDRVGGQPKWHQGNKEFFL
jgi:hypothetical protein